MNTLNVTGQTLIILDFVFLALVILCAVSVIIKTPPTTDKEIYKLRFAAVTFTGIMTVFIFTAVLFFGSGSSVGSQIFDRAVTSMTPLAGVILGYMFGTRGKKSANLGGAQSDNISN
ncbi:hypothetical protein [Sphingomonas bacterium]|uniref:hypothetical protein n=1 Tax=Sphingomonas bacterium TaxID=1895847 RepID=UPI002608708F|nr:hypothetical protein [Sphingomonas bacterium]